MDHAIPTLGLSREAQIVRATAERNDDELGPAAIMAALSVQYFMGVRCRAALRGQSGRRAARGASNSLATPPPTTTVRIHLFAAGPPWTSQQGHSTTAGEAMSSILLFSLSFSNPPDVRP